MFRKYIQPSVVVVSLVFLNAFAIAVKGMLLVFLFWVWLHVSTSPCLRESPAFLSAPILTTHWKGKQATFFKKNFKKLKKARLKLVVSRVC